MDQISTDNIKPKVALLEHAKSYSGERNGYKYCINVMISAKESGGAWTYTHDTYEKNFVVSPHYHKEHDEIFSILEGEMEWKIGDSSHVTTPGTVLWIPKGTPHSFIAITDCKMNMFFSPGGYEYVEEEYARRTQEELEDKNKMKAILENIDIFKL